ncbi:MAG: Dps family protein [Dongiaceae bacterium]
MAKSSSAILKQLPHPSTEDGLVKSPQAVIKALQHVFADSFSLYYKTHSAHWHIEGPQFFTLHQFFETLYKDIWGALDTIAEHLRSRGAEVALSMETIVKESHIEGFAEIIEAQDMLQSLIEDQEHMIEELHKGIQLAQKAGDEASADLCVERLREHEKQLWMIRSHLV